MVGNRIRVLVVVATLAWLPAMPLQTLGAAPPMRKTGAKNTAPAKTPMALTPAREAAARTFVGQHQPELAKLLTYLKQKQPRQYERAVRELFRTSERLAQIRERDPARYDLELRAWKTQSLVTLLAARWKMQPNPQLRKELEQAIDRQFALLREQLLGDRKRLNQRLNKIEAQIERLDTARRNEVQRRFRQLTDRRPDGKNNQDSGSGKIRKDARPGGNKGAGKDPPGNDA